MSTAKKTSVQKDIQENVNTSTEQNPQKIPKFPFLMRRFFEILAVSVICSLPIALIYQFGFTRAEIWATRLMGTSLVAFILINAYLLRAFYFSMGNRKIYFSVNAVAYVMFSILNIAALFFMGDSQLPSVYSYIFMPMKFTNVIINMIINTSNSSVQISCAILTHLIMLGVIIVSPFEMYSFDKKRK